MTRILKRLANQLIYLFFILPVTVSFFATPTTEAQADNTAVASEWDQNDHVGLRLISAVSGTGKLKEIPLGLEFRIKKGWKIYWRSPGDAGYPPQPNWDQSINLADYRLGWPRPERFFILGLQSLGYEDHVILPLTVEPVVKGGPLTLKAEVNYLTCEEICVPYLAKIDFRLPVGPANPTEFAQQIDKYSALIPHAIDEMQANPAGLTVNTSGFDITNPQEGDGEIRLEITSEVAVDNLDVIVEGPEGSYFDPPKLSFDSDKKRAIASIRSGAMTSEQLNEAPLTLTVWSGERAIETKVQPKIGLDHLPLSSGGDRLAGSFIYIILISLLGGVILNLMPCVLPVLSIKVLSILNHSGHTAQQIRVSFLATTAGIISAFLLLAGVLILTKQAGYLVGWGIQFQQPIFLTFMLFVILGFAANLVGLFQVALPDRIAAGAATAGQDQEGWKGHFLTGVFATLLATPCSAPFLGTAVGFALSQGPSEIVTVFFFLGLGLAAPYLLFLLFPRLIHKLPKPGRWMNWVKIIMALALLATALWIATILQVSVGDDAAVILLLLGLSMIGILYLRKSLSAHLRKMLSGISILPAAIAFAFLIFSPNLALQDKSGSYAAADSIDWVVFDPAAIQKHVSAGKSVFIDVTADWCITCKFNKNTVLSDSEIIAWLDQPDVVAMRADWTLPNDEIARYLQSNGRYGIPFNIIYSPKKPEGVALPELLTVALMTATIEETGAANSVVENQAN